MIQKKDNYNIGDVISLKTRDGKYHNHRIVKINNIAVSTKGDNLEQQWYECNVQLGKIQGIVKLLFPR